MNARKRVWHHSHVCFYMSKWYLHTVKTWAKGNIIKRVTLLKLYDMPLCLKPSEREMDWLLLLKKMTVISLGCFLQTSIEALTGIKSIGDGHRNAVSDPPPKPFNYLAYFSQEMAYGNFFSKVRVMCDVPKS